MIMPRVNIMWNNWPLNLFFIAHNILGSPGATTKHMQTAYWKAIFPFFKKNYCLHFSSLGRSEMQCRELKNEFFKHLGCPGLAIFMDTEPQNSADLCCPRTDLIPPEWICNPTRWPWHIIYSGRNHIIQCSWWADCIPHWIKLADK
jgi:hypothetical protein